MKTSSFIKLVAILIILVIGSTSPSFSQNPDQLFQKGLVKEEGEGSLQEAIDIYNKVFDDLSASRPLRANALFHVALCYEKLGQKKAKETYEKLIREFADQKDLVAKGQKKLSILNTERESKTSEGIIVREIWSPAEDTYGVSPDGRYLNYIDWYAIEIAVKDQKTGTTRSITKKGTWESPMKFPDASIWSPDGKQLAYYWFNGDTAELHIINFDGSEDRIIYSGSDEITPWPLDWSPDGKNILAVNSTKEKEEIIGQIVLVSVVDGSIRVLKTIEELQCGCWGRFSPDNKQIAYSLQQEQGSENNDIFVLALDGSYDEPAVLDPADDENAVWIPDGSGLIFLSDRMGTNDLWSVQLKKGIPQDEPELLKSNLGEEIRLFRMTDNQTLYYSVAYFRSDIYTAQIDFSSGEILSKSNKITKADHGRNISPTMSPDGRYVIYQLFPSYQDKILGHQNIFIIHDTETGNDRELETNLYGNIGHQWNQPRYAPNGKHLLVWGRTVDKLQGIFLVDILTGKHTPILVKERESRAAPKPVANFPIFSGDGQDIFYISTDRKRIIKRNIASKKEKIIYENDDEISHFSLSLDGSMISLVYSFNNKNAIYIISVNSGEIRKVAGFKDKTNPFILAWDVDGENLIFKRCVFGENESHTHEIWRVGVESGLSEKIVSIDDLFHKGYIRRIEAQNGGQHLVVCLDSGNAVEVWAMENILKK